MRRIALLVSLFVALALPASAAINPAEFQRVGSDHLRIRETARIVAESEAGGHRVRRVTLVGEVLEAQDSPLDRQGETIVIDYSVDLDARDAAREAHQRENGNRPGPQFMHEPDPPALDADGAFWAHLAKSGGRLGNFNRHAGAVQTMGTSYKASSNVYAPVAGQYSFERPF